MTTTAAQTRTAPAPELLDRFADIVGASNALRDPADMAPHLTEWRDRYFGKAALVLKPGSTDEVARILALANETGTGVVPQGGNTGLVGGQIPFESGHELVVSLARMSRIRAVDPEGNSMTVEAGVPLQMARDTADSVGRLFPLSLASQGSCQIGGNLATNAGGTAVLAYGNARELTLGLEVVLADGRIWRGLRALRKDNTGYDLKDLFIGSEGTLGIITAAVLKLFPKPTETATAFAGLDNPEQASALFTLARQVGGPELTAFELMPRFGLDIVLKHGAQVRDPLEGQHRWYALAELSGHGAPGETAKRLETLLEKALDAGIVADAAVAASLAQAQAFWRLRELLSEVQKLEGGSIKHDVSVPVSGVPKFIARANACVTELVPGCRPLPFGHFGDGNIHYNVSQPVDMERDTFLAEWDRVTAAVHEIVVAFGGSVSAEHGIGRMKRTLLQHVKSDVELGLMQQIKAGFDPNGILNPGKLL